jgi:ribulose 1,5-bisphosphate carboxylase large subunit-like protein
MTKNSKTDSGAFNSIRFGKIDFKKDAEDARKEAAKQKAERIAAFKSLIASDEAKLAKTKKHADSTTEKIQYSGAPEFLEARRDANVL